MIDETNGPAPELNALLGRVSTGEPIEPTDYASDAVQALAFAIVGDDHASRAAIDRARRNAADSLLTWEIEGGHQVADSWRAGSLRNRRRFLAGDLGLDDAHQRLAVLVAVLLGVELAGHGRDELLGHLPLGGLDLDVAAVHRQLVDGPDFVGPVEGGQEHRLGIRVDGGQLLAVLHDDLADRAVFDLVGEDLAEEEERLLADRIRLEVVGALHELGAVVLLVGVDEHRDLDGSDRLQWHVSRSSSVTTTYRPLLHS